MKLIKSITLSFALQFFPLLLLFIPGSEGVPEVISEPSFTIEMDSYEEIADVSYFHSVIVVFNGTMTCHFPDEYPPNTTYSVFLEPSCGQWKTDKSPPLHFNINEKSKRFYVSCTVPEKTSTDAIGNLTIDSRWLKSYTGQMVDIYPVYCKIKPKPYVIVQMFGQITGSIKMNVWRNWSINITNLGNTNSEITVVAEPDSNDIEISPNTITVYLNEGETKQLSYTIAQTNGKPKINFIVLTAISNDTSLLDDNKMKLYLRTYEEDSESGIQISDSMKMVIGIISAFLIFAIPTILIAFLSFQENKKRNK